MQALSKKLDSVDSSWNRRMQNETPPEQFILQENCPTGLLIIYKGSTQATVAFCAPAPWKAVIFFTQTTQKLSKSRKLCHSCLGIFRLITWLPESVPHPAASWRMLYCSLSYATKAEAGQFLLNFWYTMYNACCWPDLDIWGLRFWSLKSCFLAILAIKIIHLRPIKLICTKTENEIILHYIISWK